MKQEMSHFASHYSAHIHGTYFSVFNRRGKAVEGDDHTRQIFNKKGVRIEGDVRVG